MKIISGLVLANAAAATSLTAARFGSHSHAVGTDIALYVDAMDGKID